MSYKPDYLFDFGMSRLLPKNNNNMHVPFSLKKNLAIAI